MALQEDSNKEYTECQKGRHHIHTQVLANMGVSATHMVTLGSEIPEDDIKLALKVVAERSEVVRTVANKTKIRILMKGSIKETSYQCKDKHEFDVEKTRILNRCFEPDEFPAIECHTLYYEGKTTIILKFGRGFFDGVCCHRHAQLFVAILDIIETARAKKLRVDFARLRLYIAFKGDHYGEIQTMALEDAKQCRDEGISIARYPLSTGETYQVLNTKSADEPVSANKVYEFTRDQSEDMKQHLRDDSRAGLTDLMICAMFIAYKHMCNLGKAVDGATRMIVPTNAHEGTDDSVAVQRMRRTTSRLTREDKIEVLSSCSGAAFPTHDTRKDVPTRTFRDCLEEAKEQGKNWRRLHRLGHMSAKDSLAPPKQPQKIAKSEGVHTPAAAPYRPSMGLANFGNNPVDKDLDNNPLETLKVCDYVPTLSYAKTMPWFLYIAQYTAVGGRLCYNVMWADGCLDRRTATEFGDCVHSVLSRVVANEFEWTLGDLFFPEVRVNKVAEPTSLEVAVSSEIA